MAEETTPDNLPGGNAFSQEGSTNLNDFLPFGGKEPDLEDRSKPSMLRNMYPQMDSIDVPDYNIKDNVSGLSPYTNQKSFKGLSVKDQVRALGNLTISKLNTLQDPNTYGKIKAYDSSPTGAHRARYAAYGRETFDRLGFNPEVNNEAIYNDQTTAWDDFVRMAKHSAWPLYAKGFVANPKSYAGIFSGDYKQDPDEAYDYEEANSIGMSTKGGVGAFLTNAVNSFSYSAGIITEAIVEDAVIGGILGAEGGPEGVAAGSFIGGAIGTIKGLATVPKALYQMTRSGATLLKNLKSLDKVNDARIAFNTASKTVGDFINPFNNTAEALAYNKLQNSNNLRNMARTSNTFGAFYKDVRNINMALSEGRLEGGFVQNNTYKELYDKYYAQHGVAPSDEKQREFMDVARKAGADDTWYNTMLIFYTNKLVIPNVMRGGVLRSIPGYTDDILDLGTHKILWNPKANFELVRSNFKNSIKALAKPAYYGKSAAAYFKANVSEGLQENMQDVLSEYTQRSYIDAYNDPSKATWDYSKGLLKNAVKKQFSAQGFETFASGFVIGGFAKPFNALPKYLSIGYDKYIKYGDKYEEYVEGRRKSGQDAVDTLNELYKDPKEFFNHRYFNYGLQSLTAKEDDDDSTTSKEANDARDRAFISQMVTVLETGTMKYFIDHIDGFKDMQPEEIEKAFGLKAGEGVNAIQRIDTIKERAKRIEKRYEYSKNKLPNPVDLSLFDKDTDEYKKAATLHQAWNVARANQIFMGESFDRNLERITGIAGNIMSIADFSNISSADLNAITDVDRLSNEIDMLSDQVKSAENAGVSDKNTIKAKQKLDDLKNIEASLKGLYVDIFARESLDEITKEYVAKGYDSQTAEMKAHEQTKEEYEKLSKELLGGFKEAVVTYLKNLSGNDTTYQEVMSKLENQGKVSGIDEMMTSLIDIHKLRHENTAMVKYINLLNDPAEYMEHVNRNYQWMYDLYKNRKNYFKDTVNRSFEEKEYNDLLQSLADQGIYVDLNEFADWIEDKTKLPSEFEDAPNKRVIKRGTPLYNEIAARFIRLAQIQEQKAAGEKVNVNEQLKEELDELEVKKQKELDAAREKYEEALKEETGFTEEELKTAPETETAEVDSALANNLKSIADEIESISIQTDKDVEKLIELADKANQFINEDEFIKRYDNLTKKEKEQVKEINKGFNKKAGEPEDNTYARIVKYLTPLMIQEELDRMAESEVEDSEAKINIEETQAYKDYQEAIAEINARYEQLAQDLFEEYKKKGAAAKTAEEAKEAVIKPTTETQWEDLPEELRAKLQPLFDKYLKTNFPKEKDDSRLSLIRSNWLKTQGNEIDAYNNAQFGTEDVEEVLLKEPPKFKSLKASSETLKTKNIKELLLIRDALQKKLDTRKKLVNNKPVALTKKEIADITSDIRDLNGYIAYRRTLQPLKSEALQTSEDLKRNILDVQDQVEEIKDADGHVIGRRIIGVNTTDVSARVTEEVDLIKRQLNPDYDGVLYNGLKNKEDGSPGTIDVLIEQVQNDKNFDTKEKQVDAFVKALEAAYKERKIKKFGSDRKLKLVKDFFLDKDNPKEFTRDNIRYIIGNLASQESAIAGQTVDQIGRDFFQDVKIKKPANMSEIAYKNLLAILNKLGDKIRGSKDQEIVSERIILFNREYVSPSGKKGLTGEIDLLKLTIDGEYYILDMKTGSRFTWDNFEIDEKEAEVIDLLKPTAFKTKGPSISEESIDWDKSDYSLEDVIDDIGSIKSIKVLETEGADKKGVVRGTVRIQGNNGKTDIEVVFTSGTIKQEVNDNKFSKKLDYSAQLTFYRNLFTIMMNGKKPAGMFLLPFEIELEGEDGYIKDLKLASIADPDTMLYELNEVEEVNKLLPISNLPEKSETGTTDAKADIEKKKSLSQELISFVWDRLAKQGITNADSVVGTRDTIDSVDFNKFWSTVTKEDLQNLRKLYETKKQEQLDLYNKFKGKFDPSTGTFTSNDTSFFDNKIKNVDAELAALGDQAQYTEYKPKSQKLASNVNKTVIYNGKVGTLINFPHESGSYGIETEDSIFEINGYDDSKMNDLGISTIRLNPELFSNPVIDDVKYNIEFTSEDKSTANINGVNYTIERNAKGGVKSLTYEAHEDEIAKLSEEIDAIQKKYDTAAENMQKAIDAGEDDIMIAPMNLQLVRISNKLEFLKARLSNLSANNKLVTTRNRALIQALQSLPDSFKKSTTKDEEDEDLDNLSNLGESGTAITDMNDILDEDYPAKFDMLITDLSGLNSDDLSTFTKYANNVISKLEELQLRYEAEDKITTDIENEIVVFKTLLNYIENIKLNKNGKVSKQQPKEVRGLQKELQENENEFAIQGPESGETGEVSEQETEPGGRRSVTKQELRQIIKTVFGTKTSEQLGSEEFLEEFEESEKGLVEIEQLFEDSDPETLESQYEDLLTALLDGEEIGVSAAVLDKLYDKRRRELSKIIKTKNIKEGDYLINTKGKFTEVVKVSDISDDLYTLLNEQTDETVEMTFDQLKKNYKKYYRQMIEEETEELDEQVSDETAESASQTSTVVEETLKDTEALNKHVDELKNLSRADRRKKMNNTSKLC